MDKDASKKSIHGWFTLIPTLDAKVLPSWSQTQRAAFATMQCRTQNHCVVGALLFRSATWCDSHNCPRFFLKQSHVGQELGVGSSFEQSILWIFMILYAALCSRGCVLRSMSACFYFQFLRATPFWSERFLFTLDSTVYLCVWFCATINHPARRVIWWRPVHVYKCTHLSFLPKSVCLLPSHGSASLPSLLARNSQLAYWARATLSSLSLRCLTPLLSGTPLSSSVVWMLLTCATFLSAKLWLQIVGLQALNSRPLFDLGVGKYFPFITLCHVLWDSRFALFFRSPGWTHAGSLTSPIASLNTGEHGPALMAVWSFSL